MFFKFWGTRGSIPVPGNSTLKYGGNTPCVELRSKSGSLVVLDAGSGIRELGKKLVNGNAVNTIEILLSHYHWDHIQGLPFFLPLFDKKYKIVFHGEPSQNGGINNVLSSQLKPDFFPIGAGQLPAEILFSDIYPEKKYDIGGFTIDTFRANHSSPTIAYKISEGEKSLVYMTDNELLLNYENKIHEPNEIKSLNGELVEFCKDCDYLIHDSMYDEISIPHKKGWGHSGNLTLAMFGMLAGVKNLILFHYNPDYTDSKIDELLQETKTFLKNNGSQMECFAAGEGNEFEF